MEKKKKRIIIGSLLALLLLIIPIPIAVVLLNKPAIQQQETKKILPFNDMSMSDIYISKTIDKYQKNINKQTYSTKLLEQYQQNGFKYPSWDHSYKSDATDRQLPTNQEIQQNGLPSDIRNNRYMLRHGGNYLNKNDYIDNSLNIYNETAQLINQDGTVQEVKYSDPRFINQEIKNGTLKRHPWANHAYLNGLTDTVTIVNKEFEIGSQLVGWTSLGLYAPPGEVVTLEFDDQTFEYIQKYNYSGFDIFINEGYWDQNQGFNGAQKPNEEYLTKNKIGVRMPFMQSSFRIDPNKKQIQFGTPYGGSISLKINSRLVNKEQSIMNDAYLPLKFKVKGAIENLHYIHGVTTEQDWNEQIKKVKNKEIVSPIFSAYFSFASIHIPFTNNKPDVIEIGHYNIDETVYPKDVFDKVYDFLFLSQYQARNDIHGNAWRESFKFSDDVWGGAGAWGGQWHLFANSDSGARLFLLGSDYFNPRDAWGIMHEINHAWQQNEALFSKRTHPETNQTTAASLTLINDNPRKRSPYNIYNDWKIGSGDWSRLTSPYGLMNVINNNLYQDSREYDIYALLLFNWGTFRYFDYVRDDMENDPCNRPGWTGLDEIVRFSNYFKINYWPTFEKYGQKWWNDTWPNSYNQATPDQKQKIDSLNKYPAADLMGNLYACGMYFYNYQTKQYEYTNDYAPAYEIPAGIPYVFNFEKYIATYNDDFSWDQLIIPETTKLGSKLIRSKTNNKIITYVPNINNADEIDEFDIEIKPNNFTNKPSNYVPGYKWKIKIRQTLNQGLYKIYKPITNGNLYGNGFSEMTDENVIYENTCVNPLKLQPYETGLFDDNKWKGVSVEFKFVVPKTGKYTIEKTSRDCLNLNVDGTEYRMDYYAKDEETQKPEPVRYHFNWNAGEVHNIKIKSIWKNFQQFRIDMRMYLDNIPINIKDQILVPYIDEIIKEIKYKGSYEQLLKDPKFKYKPRRVNYNDFIIPTKYLMTSSAYETIETNKFSLEDKTLHDEEGRKYGVQYLTDDTNDNNKKYEVMNGDCQTPGKKEALMKFEVNFLNPQTISAVSFKRARYENNLPTRATIKGYDVSGKEYIMYDNSYGYEFNDGRSDLTVLNFNDSFKDITKLSFHFENRNAQGSHIIALKAMKLYEQKVIKTKQMYGYAINDDTKIKITGTSRFVKNQEGLAISPLNNISLCLNSSGSGIEFSTDANIIQIMGSKTTKEALFDVYVDNKIYQANVSARTNTIDQFNVSLINIISNNNKSKKIKLVLKTNTPLYIGYINNMKR